jgi:beta-lactamase regulating signal transducer with metallopeptidase domain
MLPLLETTIKVSLLLLSALVAATLLRSRSAEVRHWILTASMACAAAIPALQLVVPSWQPSFAQPSFAQLSDRSAVQIETSATVRIPPGPEVAGKTAGTVSSSRWRLAISWVRTVWITGAIASISWLLVGLARLAWLAGHARPVLVESWMGPVREISYVFGLRRPVNLLQSDHPTVLVTWGLLQPKVLLPNSALHWPDDRVRVVLSHELAHILRRDWLTQMAAELVKAVYWFNPIVWLACCRLRQESEYACDDAVLSRGVDGAEYARHLLDLVRAARAGRGLWFPAPAVARPSNLERRIAAMLSTRVNRSPITRTARIVTLLAVVNLTIALAGFAASAQGAFSTLSGTILDSTNAVVSGVTLRLTHVQSAARHEVRSDQTGHFEFIGLPRGDYELTSERVGFAPLSETFQVNGNTQRDITLQVGSLEETISVVDTGEPRAADNSVGRRRSTPPELGTCQPSSTGGHIRPPLKIRHAWPRYPQHLGGAGIGGTIVLKGRIGTDGFLKELEAIAPVNTDLASAAVDAVRQWQWTPTLLNCMPVEVPITVSVRFSTQR